MFRTILSILLIASSAKAFVTNGNSMRTSAMLLQDQSMAFDEKVAILAAREFQLEEKEDKDVEQTRIWLNPDGTVTLSDTDGPKFVGYEGRWSMVDEASNPFRMLLYRKYGGGMKQIHSTDMGEFDYTVRREFKGDLNMIGSTVNVEGVVNLLDENGGSGYEVGYFALIDNSADLEQ
ncbi:unnamed protein product [Cylindrotheca closterium]|uniref:Uncharacterized protein n=1 Tax=Cylindrotheca closterium TaxID=2856 RepID=A0AAD2CQ69_9STRA|nr:unnamed protein product [Cylindrotheca closterium]